MSESKAKNWQQNVYRLYQVSFIAWAVATVLVLVKFLSSGFEFRFGLMDPAANLFQMLLALPGLLFFYLQSRKLRTASPELAQTIFARIMAVQHPTGLIAMAGGLLGSLPFLVNFFGFLSMSPSDMWMNVNAWVAWTSLYGFITTYIFALVINRQSKKQNQPEPEA